MMNQPNQRQWTDVQQRVVHPASEVTDHPESSSSETASGDDASDAYLETISKDADFSWAIIALDDGREEILSSWLRAAREQPFHLARPDRAVGDHIPLLYDAVAGFLKITSRSPHEPGSPLDDPAVLQAANAHADSRAEQGLQPSEIVTEFRLLRRAIWQGLHNRIADVDSIENLVSAELLVNDAIDGAITVGLEKLSTRVERLREDFLVATVHDIRQPITAIKGLAQLSGRYLDRAEPDLERAHQALAGIETQSDQMNRTIDILIDVSRAALGHLAFESSFVDLARLIPDIVAENGVAELREVRMTLPDEGVATGYWDVTRLRQVMTNLLSNAVKYSPSGGLIEIVVQASAELVEVSVRDFGMGLEPEELPKIFGRYYRTPRAMRSSMEGSGIGLYLCAHIIEGHGGAIWAESDGPETGTTIRFNLPQRPISQPGDNES